MLKANALFKAGLLSLIIAVTYSSADAKNKNKKNKPDTSSPIVEASSSKPKLPGGVHQTTPNQKVTLGGTHPRKLTNLNQLVIMTYNVENLFVTEIDRTTGIDNKEASKKKKKPAPKAEGENEIKSPESLDGVAKAIKDVNPDIIIAEEVDNLHALETLNVTRLNGEYECFLIEGNDQRGIDVGFMVKKDLPLIVEEETHKDFMWMDPVSGDKVKIFSRDLPNLNIRTHADEDPVIIIFGNHAKSKRDRAGDKESNKFREAQYEAAANIISSYEKQYPKAHIIMAGDFNTDLQKSNEVKPVKAILHDAFDVAQKTLSPKERITHSLHLNGQPVAYSQLDGLLVSDSMKDIVVEANIYRYKNADGSVKPLPKTFEDRAKNPSDHMPPWMSLDAQSLF